MTDYAAVHDRTTNLTALLAVAEEIARGLPPMAASRDILTAIISAAHATTILHEHATAMLKPVGLTVEQEYQNGRTAAHAYARLGGVPSLSGSVSTPWDRGWNAVARDLMHAKVNR